MFEEVQFDLSYSEGGRSFPETYLNFHQISTHKFYSPHPSVQRLHAGPLLPEPLHLPALPPFPPLNHHLKHQNPQVKIRRHRPPQKHHHPHRFPNLFPLPQHQYHHHPHHPQNLHHPLLHNQRLLDRQARRHRFHCQRDLHEGVVEDCQSVSCDGG